MLDVLADSPDLRLPELFAGYEREGAAFPVDYPTSCRPQAWAAGAVPLFVRTLLGLDCGIDGRLTSAPILPPSVGRLRATVIVRGDPVTLEVRARGDRVELERVHDPRGRLASVDL